MNENGAFRLITPEERQVYTTDPSAPQGSAPPRSPEQGSVP